jgi:chromatin modification-related protein VID21
MSEVGAADRSRLLRSKRAEIRYINSPLYTIRERTLRRIDACRYHGADNCSGIVASRKRKLREFFAVCDNDGPIPQLDLSNVDAPPTNAAEAHFLEVTDILQYVALPIYGGLESLRFFVVALGGI